MAAQCVAVVDPASTGCCLALECIRRGYPVIAVWTLEISPDLRAHRPESCRGLAFHSEVTELPDLDSTAAAVKEAAGRFQLTACMVGCETGVTVADALSERLGLRSNGTCVPQRRDKKVQQDLVRAAGLRAIRQSCGKAVEDVVDFLATEEMPVVVKPVESAGSDGVKLCHTAVEARLHFELLMSAQQKVGSKGAAVLCQEFLKGREYVVDHVSRDGVHKTVMLWVYDKRAVNGAAFVYHGMLPLPADSPQAQILIPYVRGVLDAMQIRNGPTHGEVIMTAAGPCLVEMNCRAHGGDGTFVPLARALTGGYSQVDAAADSFLDEQSFGRLPDRPPAPFRAAGQEVNLVSFTAGKALDMPGYREIRQMASFLWLEETVTSGSQVEPSIDMFTNVGSAILMHEDEETLKADVERIREMERSGALFHLEGHPAPRTSCCSDSEEVVVRSRASSDLDQSCEHGRRRSWTGEFVGCKVPEVPAVATVLGRPRVGSEVDACAAAWH